MAAVPLVWDCDWGPLFWSDPVPVMQGLLDLIWGGFMRAPQAMLLLSQSPWRLVSVLPSRAWTIVSRKVLTSLGSTDLMIGPRRLKSSPTSMTERVLVSRSPSRSTVDPVPG